MSLLYVNNTFFFRWEDPKGLDSPFRDEWRIKRSVLLEHHPNMCENLKGFRLNDSCSEFKKRLSKKEGRTLAKELFKYARKNLLWLNVYVKDSFATRIVRDEKMTRTSFVANVGGLLGLCMGFSLVSVVEVTINNRMTLKSTLDIVNIICSLILFILSNIHNIENNVFWFYWLIISRIISVW